MNKPERDLFLLGLKEGDLVQLCSNQMKIKGKAKVVVGSGWAAEGEGSYSWMSTSWYFKYVDDGSLGVYIRSVVTPGVRDYWRNFHHIHCDGMLCVVHKKYLYPSNWSNT